ncbi:alpha/beta hydrolase [Microlunatus ginsengisoli]|uniref:Alpha/beta hydrolase n=1 Tax=Microlunatus ginsengisoli TaxID=363863 RepID=A0ABP7AFA1_9ACTN
MGLARRAAAALAVALLGLGGCAAPTPSPARSAQLPSEPARLPSRPADGRPVQPVPDVRPEGFAEPPPGAGLDRYRGQRLRWQACGSLQCATLLVPLDYARPDGTAITLTIGRRPYGGADGSGRVVFANPGGPGGSGLSFLAGLDGNPFGPVDVVSWDPRGSGASTPVRCWGDTAMDAYAGLDLSADDPAERTALVDGAQRFGLSCLAGSGALLAHLSTAETARDLDLIRSALGLATLDYVGLSNGTLIGADYAQLFPDRVGRFVLDGAVNISGSPVLQLQGFDRALEAMADWCVSRTSKCALGTTRADVIGIISGLWTRLEQRPLAVGDRTLTQTLAADATLQALYAGEGGYPVLIDALDRAERRGDGSRLLRLADGLLGRRADGSWTQFAVAYPASHCADEPNTGLAAAWQDAAAEARKAPIFGPVVGADVECAVWPVDAPKGLGKVTAPTAPPLIVIGTTGDPATPYEWAQGMAGQLPSAILVTHRGTGHTAFGSACYAEIVRPYLADGRLPQSGTAC